MQFPKFLQSAFDRLGNDQESMKSVAANTATTAASVTVGGDLYEKLDHLVTAIENMKGGIGGTTNLKEALALRIVTPALKPIGLGLGFIIDALNNAPGGKELGKKMDAIVGGLVKLGQVGKAILSFAGYIILAIPFLMVAAATIPIWAPLIFIITKTLMWAAKSLDKKTLKSLNDLGEVGINLLVLAGSLALIGLIAVPAIKGALTAAVIILAVGGIFKLLQTMDIAETLEEVGQNLISAGLGILGLVVFLALSGFILEAVGFEPLMKVLAVVGATALTFFIVGLFSNQIEKGARALMYAAGSIIVLGLSLLFIKYVLGELGGGAGTGDSMDLMNALPSLGVIIAIGLIFAIAGQAAESIAKGALAMIVVGISLIVLSFGLDFIKDAVPDFDTGLGILAMVGGLALVFGIAGAGPVPMAIALGAGALALVGLSLLVISLGLAVIGPVVSKMTLPQAGMIAIIIGGLAAGFAAAGLASPLIILGSVAMILAGGATVILAGALKLLSFLDFSSLGSINETGNKAFNFSGQVSKGLFGIGKGRKKTNFEVAMDAIATGMSLGPLQIIGILAGAPTLILASTALIGIATGLRVFKMIIGDADLPSLKTNMNFIVSGLAEVFANVGEKYGGGGGGFMAALRGSGGEGTSVVAQGISAVGGMGRALKGIARGVQAMADLKFPTGYDKDGNPTGYETINLTKAIPNLVANTKEIVIGLSGAFAEVGGAEAAKGGGWFSKNPYEKGIAVVKKMGEPLANLAKGVQAMANLKFPTEFDKDGNPTKYEAIGNIQKLSGNLKTNTKALVLALSGVFEEIGKSDAGKGGGWFSKSDFERGIMITEMLSSPYSSLADSVKDVQEIVKGVTNPTEIKEKVGAMIQAITAGEEDDVNVIEAKTGFIRVLGNVYEKLGKAIPSIVDSIAKFTIDKAKAFASIFGGESPAKLFESKTKFMNSLQTSYLRMAIAIPLIVGSINSVEAEQLESFSSVYGGSMAGVEDATLTTRNNLFTAVGSAYEKVGTASGKIATAINSLDEDKLVKYKGLFIGDVSRLRPIAGYEAQTELWEAIGENTGKASSSMPGITEAINNLDMSKLVESRKMFEALGVLANGGSASDILEKMGESLEDAMERLADILMEFQTSVGEASSGQEGMLTQLASMPGDFLGAIRQGAGAGGSGDSGKITRAITDLRRALQDTGIKVKELPSSNALDILNRG